MRQPRVHCGTNQLGMITNRKSASPRSFFHPGTPSSNTEAVHGTGIGPRDENELHVVAEIVETSHAYAPGASADSF